MIPLSVPNISGNEWEYVKECLDTGWVSTVGSFVDRFERDFCLFTGAAHAVATNSGTAALHLALRVVGVEKDDEVLVPTVTFIAPINAVTYVGAHPVFFDCDDYFNISASDVESFLSSHCEVRDGNCFNRTSGRRIRAIIPVHTFGNPADMPRLCAISREFGLKVVEDASESLGASIDEVSTGLWGDIGCFSFNGNKIITTGGGGMLITNNSSYAEYGMHLSTQAKADALHYVHDDIGYNYRLTNISAALGVAQLECLPRYLAAKRENFELYRELLTDIPGIEIANTPPYGAANHWFYCLRIDPDVYGKSRDELMAHMQSAGIQCRPIWKLNHLQEPHRNAQCTGAVNATNAFEHTLNLPCSTSLTEEEVQQVVNALREV